jgi:hypothetical protein
MERPLTASISIAQLRRRGWLRCIVGGGAMDLTIPAFIGLDVGLVVALDQ